MPDDLKICSGQEQTSQWPNSLTSRNASLSFTITQFALFHDLAARVGTASAEHSDGNRSVWFENGRKVLDYIQSDNRCSAESFKDRLQEQGVLVNEDALIPLLTNMQSLSKQWRESVGKHGELVFYVDNC